MFAPKIAKAPTEAPDSPTRKLAPQPYTLGARPSGGGAVEQAQMLQRTIGSQATLRHLTQRPSNLPTKGPAELYEQQAASENMTARTTLGGLSWDFSKVPVLAPDRSYQTHPSPPLAATPLPGAIQAKLAVGQVDDPLEQEADRVADRVMRMSAPTPAVTAPRFPVNHKLAQGEAEADGLVQSKSVEAGVDAVALAPAIVHDVVQSPGRPLDPATRAFFEPQFGYDLSSVRVHTDARADSSAQTVNANAYTVGQNIVFGAGRFAPHQSDGRKLLAHELAHVVQQRRPEAAAAGQENCEQDAQNAAHSIGRGITPVVRSGAVFGTVQRQSKGPAAQKKSGLVRVERYWRSTSARAFFADGSNEEVTFVDTSKLDGSSRPEGTFERVLNLTVDRSSTIRPRVDLASGTSGTNVKVVTRLSPADRISKLPTEVRAEMSEAFLGDTENEPSPEMMEFAADMGDRLKETSGTTKIEMKGRDPATVATMKTVDQWVSDQKSSLDKVGTMHRGKFAHLLDDIRQVGVTGPAKAEDLDAEDIELVLAGTAGGQSEFQTFDEFKVGMNFKLRTGRTSIPEANVDNPDFHMRNEYRRAWKAEAVGLRRMSRIAAAAQAAPFVALGASAAVGVAAVPASAAAGAGLAKLGLAGEAANEWFAARGVSSTLLGKWVGTSLVASSVVSNFGSARDEAKAAGVDPNSARGLVSTVSAAFLRGIGIGDVAEDITDTSMQTGKSLNRSPLQRIVGAVGGSLNMLGMSDSFVPDAPGGLPAVGKTSGARAGIEDADAAGGMDSAAQPVAQGKGGQDTGTPVVTIEKVELAEPDPALQVSSTEEAGSGSVSPPETNPLETNPPQTTAEAGAVSAQTTAAPTLPELRAKEAAAFSRLDDELARLRFLEGEGVRLENEVEKLERRGLGRAAAQRKTELGAIDEAAKAQELKLQKARWEHEAAQAEVRRATPPTATPDGRTRSASQSEDTIGENIGRGHTPQVSYHLGKPVPYGSEDSVRPDWVADDGSSCFEVKNYNLENNSRGLINKVVEQTKERVIHLPAGMQQNVVIDLASQQVSEALKGWIIDQLVGRTGGVLQPHNIVFWD